MARAPPSAAPVTRPRTGAEASAPLRLGQRIFGNEFEQVGITREVPVERLVDGSYRDNLELIQWFKDLYEAQVPVSAAIPVEMCHAFPYMYATAAYFGSHGYMQDYYRFTEDNHEETGPNAEETGTSAGALEPYREHLYWLQLERNFYYNKLCEIEVLCWEHERDHGKECVAEKVLDVMRGGYDEDWYGADEDTTQSGAGVAQETEQEPE
ncbi:hypothetical protein HPB51_002108 [Rhipicephalus microplus]|uniref:EB1 C-terminal domain-containing protein n=1 Tax=Rhipicephalus microplus TaxID=6941 RepID=A0A9J6E522_RHIMP|nr:hypothetical protein HPB51_002108 [Rhipicephalus microplus]